jgi:hypothetical protein
MDTPASARHKRGCNCKKSLCLKKYCECYQVDVCLATLTLVLCLFLAAAHSCIYFSQLRTFSL